MYNFLVKNSTSVAFGLGALVSIIAVIAIMSGIGGYETLTEDERGTTSIFNAGLMGAIVLMILAAVLMVGFGLYYIITNPKGGIRFILGLVGIVLIGFLFYQFSAAETSGKVYERMQLGELSAGVSKILNGALWAAIILTGVALLGLVFSEIRNLFK